MLTEVHFGILISIKYYYLHEPTGGSRPLISSGTCDFLRYQKSQPTCHLKVRVVAYPMGWCVWCYKQQCIFIFFLSFPFPLIEVRLVPPHIEVSLPFIFLSTVLLILLISFNFFPIPSNTFGFIWLIYRTQSSLS